MHTVGVVGNGYVGYAVAIGFSPVTDVKVWDIEPRLADDTLEEVAQQDIIFICVPTPTIRDDLKYHSAQNDTSAVDETIERVMESREREDPPIIVIKSTVWPGTCQRHADGWEIPVISNPEFLSARYAVEDFTNPVSVVLGGEDVVALHAVYGLYRERFPGARIIVYDKAETAEMIKYVRNGFSAVKMAFLNEIAALCRQLGLDYGDIKEGLLASNYVNQMHCDVPGHDGKLGFGGACLPKDGRALVGFGYQERVPQTVLEAALRSNERIRHGD